VRLPVRFSLQRNFEEGEYYPEKVSRSGCGLWMQAAGGMGLSEGSTAFPRGPGLSTSPARCVGVLVVLLLGSWGTRAQSEFQTSSVYLWKTGK